MGPGAQFLKVSGVDDSGKRTRGRQDGEGSVSSAPVHLVNPPCLILPASRCVRAFSCSVVSDSATSWMVAHQAPLSLVFSRQENWSGLPFPTPGDLPDLGIKPESLASPASAGGFFTT